MQGRCRAFRDEAGVSLQHLREVRGHSWTRRTVRTGRLEQHWRLGAGAAWWSGPAPEIRAGELAG